MDKDSLFPLPLSNQFTVYSKSGCPNCSKVKKLLQDKKLLFTVINCDEYILEDKIAFLEFIQMCSGTQHRTFPMVFNDTKFVGGYADTIEYTEHILSFSEEDF
jgi:glutaredoxin 3